MPKFENNFGQPPVGNTGVTCPRESAFFVDNKGEINNLGQFVLFDWLEFTIHYDFSTHFIYYNSDNNRVSVSELYIVQRINDLFSKLFGINPCDICYEARGRNSYTSCYSYKNIHAWTSTDARMGIHFEITGQGCRNLEEIRVDLFDLLWKLKSYNVKYSRIDLSIDDFTDTYYTLDKIVKYLKTGRIVTKLRTFYNTTSGIVEDYDILGSTVQLGSKASLVHITFYDKLKERRSNNYIVDDNIKFWTRTEVRFRNEKATDLVDYLIINRSINKILKGILSDYIRFVDKPKSSKDNRKRRWNTAKWWTDFLENVNTISLAPVKVYTTIQKKKVWLNDSVSKSQFMVMASQLENFELDNLSSELLLKQLKLGFSKITEKDLQLINEERLNNNMLPTTKDDLNEYLRSLKDVILINEK